MSSYPTIIDYYVNKEDGEKRSVSENPKHYIFKLSLLKTKGVGANLMRFTLRAYNRHPLRNC
jgi:hypothetical protein